MNANKNTAIKMEQNEWYKKGYQEGIRFVQEEADYDELAAIVRAKGIPVNWDIFRAEILNAHLDNPDFDFQAYEAGFSQACTEIYEKI